MSDQTLWWIAIAAAFVVTLVVGVLLWAIISVAERIRRQLAAIWGRGQMVANNSIHIPLLERVTMNLRDADQAVERLAFAAEAAGASATGREPRP